jgi:hypothetical protein
VGERASALLVSGEVFFLTQRDRLVELATHHAIPTIYKVELLINLKTAKTLGIDIPMSMLMRVDDVIE